MELWELVARESIRETLARYNHVGDSGRVDELAAQFTREGVLEITGGPTLHGRQAIVDHLGSATERRSATAEPGAAPPVVRHHVSSVLIHDVTPDEAHAASYFAMLTRDGVDHWGRYRDTLVPQEGQWLIARRRVRVDAKVEGSWAPM